MRTGVVGDRVGHVFRPYGCPRFLSPVRTAVDGLPHSVGVFFLLSSSWTSHGHRCRPFSSPVRAVIFIARRVQHARRFSSIVGNSSSRARDTVHRSAARATACRTSVKIVEQAWCGFGSRESFGVQVARKRTNQYIFFY